MKVFISQIVDVSLEEIKQSLSFPEYKEMADYFSYQDDFKDEMIEAIGLDESDHLANISDDYMNRYIKDNIGYYSATSKMQNKIDRLERELYEAEPPKLTIPNNPHDAHRFFCDLLGLGCHVSHMDILSKISDTIQ